MGGNINCCTKTNFDHVQPDKSKIQNQAVKRNKAEPPGTKKKMP